MAGMRAEVKLMRDGTAQVLAKVKGLTDKELFAFAHEVRIQARENAAALPFEESTGELAREIHVERLGESHYQIETKSGHASFIEFGTRFIDGKMPFLWPAYRAIKRKFLRARPWV